MTYYAVDGYPGIMFHILGPLITHEYVEYLNCISDDCCHDDDNDCYVPDYEIVESETMVRAVMPGDDHEHVFHVDDMTEITKE